MKLLADMNLSPKWAGFLSAAGFEALHWSALGAPTAPDTEIMRHASENDLVVPTSDLDFGTILAITHAALATRLDDLRIPPQNRLEALQGDRKGQWSIRINDQWRVCFVWDDGQVFDVEIVDYH